MLIEYLKRIADISNRGDAREESYYSTLENLIAKYAESIGKKNIHITTLPKKTDAGNPDFRIWDGNQHITGYVEAKAPTVEYLDQAETSNQLKRYLHTFPNVILTNFLEFRLYRNGQMTARVAIARPFVMQKLKAVPSLENEDDFLKLLEKFFSFTLPKVNVAKGLALELAKRTRFLRDEVITEELKKESDDNKSHIDGFYNAFRKYLIGGLTKEEFADIYSQTITYGLFAARMRADGGFNRKIAYDYIPRTIGILKDVFKFISLEDLPQQMEWIIDDIAEVLAVTDVSNILHKYFHEGKGKDPVIHFYETFLAEYDPKTREKRGVYYTPEPVVSYIVRSLHKILKEKFNKPDGLAAENVTVLDPAAGTLTFLAKAAELAVQEVSKYGEGIKEKFIKDHILQNYYAFELMMAPYAIGHIKMSLLLEELGYKMHKEERIKFYLTNTLEIKDLEQTEFPGMTSLAEESHLAGKIKKETPILVIFGNPPYSGHSANVNVWIDKLLKEDKDGIQSFYKVDGGPLDEKNPKWLQDDYVKFIRFAQWKINNAGEGVLGFITNHSYLDNPTFRGMRQSLMHTFHEIYILDLHGSSLKKEKCGDGSKDENVFDIKQGVAIALFIKKKNGIGCEVHHFEKLGLREDKYTWLAKNDIKTTSWKKIIPKPKYYLFVSRDEKLSDRYYKFYALNEIFIEYTLSVQTHRDHFAIDIDKNALRRRIVMFRNKEIPDEIVSQAFKLKNTNEWTIAKARQKVMEDDNWEQSILPITYRPFDRRWIFYDGNVIDRPRIDIMKNMTCANIALLVSKQQAIKGFFHALVTTQISESCAVSDKTKEGNYHFPLYLCKEKSKHKGKNSNVATILLFEPRTNFSVVKSNLVSILGDMLQKAYNRTPEPEEVLYYIYAVLYSNRYRTKYAEFLRIDFPRIPFTKDPKAFKKMVNHGKHLTDLHLLNNSELHKTITKLVKGTNKIEKVRYEKKKVYVNSSQYFEGITQDIWEYQIGGYKVCEKWLKDRKGRELSSEDIKHYCRIVTALQKTIEIQKKIDELYSQVEKNIIDFGK
jgi:predicted helicase